MPEADNKSNIKRFTLIKIKVEGRSYKRNISVTEMINKHTSTMTTKFGTSSPPMFYYVKGSRELLNLEGSGQLTLLHRAQVF